jgi:hypothetical protein
MKKLLLTSIIYLSVTSATTLSAQSNSTTANDKLIAFKSTPKPESSGIINSTKTTDINDRTMANFKKYFSEVTDDVWIKTPNGYVVRFTSNGIPNTAFLSNHGNCQSCVRYYTEKELTGDIRQQVKSTYFDFAITSVREVTYNSQTAYLVTIEDKTSWKVIRIVDGEMDVWEEHLKG